MSMVAAVSGASRSGAEARRRVAILDDWQSVALSSANWSAVEASADITVFSDHLEGEHALAERLARR